MRAQLRRLHSPDVQDLKTFSPLPVDAFGFLLQIMVGPEEQQGEDSFDVVVCTPDWLKRNFKTSDIILGQGRILVFEYNCEKCVADTWQDIATKLSRIGRWEFEGYQPYK
jgi:hypothetical protein